LHDIETLIIGAGVVGLAVARSLAMAGHEVMVLEQHAIIGSETSARNSEVIHAGIYYPQDSLKAKLCVEGKALLYEFCKSRNVRHNRIGKLIVATNDEQRNALNQIQSHALANGVDDLRLLDQSVLNALEPALSGTSALYSPSTGIIDSHAYMLALQGEAEARGAQFVFNTKAASWKVLKNGGFEIACADEQQTTLTARNLIVCGGLYASQFLAAQTSAIETVPDVPPTKFAKGNYFKLSGKAPFSHLVYPVPEPGGLGVHLTLDMGGQARFGPDVEWIDEPDYEVDPARGEKFYAAIRSYWPELPDASLEPDYAGIRPKLSGRGEPNVDFLFLGPTNHNCKGLVALLGIESPGLTASLSIAEHVRKLIA